MIEKSKRDRARERARERACSQAYTPNPSYRVPTFFRTAE